MIKLGSKYYPNFLFSNLSLIEIEETNPEELFKLTKDICLNYNIGAYTFTATSLVKTGGTSSQFLKADGTVDSNTYLTGNQTITLSGEVSGTGTTAITTTIADDIIDEANLKASNSATDNYNLIYNSSNSGFEWRDDKLQYVSNGDKTASFTHDAAASSIGNYNLSTSGAVVVSIHNLSSGYQGTIFLDITTNPSSISITGYTDAGSTAISAGNTIQLGAAIANAASKMSSITYTCASDGTNTELILQYGQEN